MPIKITHKKGNGNKLETFVLFAADGFKVHALSKTLLGNKVAYINEIIKNWAQQGV